MTERLAKLLFAAIAEIARTMVRFRLGVITATGPLEVSLGGADVSIEATSLAGSPIGVGDPVAVLTFGSDALILGVIGDPADDWIAGTYAANWSKDEAADTSPLSYRKVGDIVYLRGLVKSSSSATGQTIFTLPAGYRPDDDLYIAGSSADESARIIVQDTGGVVYANGGNATTWVSLDGISFRAEQ